MRRKRPRSSKVMLFLSVLLAVTATLVLRGHLLRLEARAAAAGPGRPVIVAEHDLGRGTVIETGAVTTRSMPEAYLPPGALASLSEVVGRRLAADVVAGEPLTAARLAPEGGAIASLVPPGLRAAPLAVPASVGLVEAGDRVDVLATFAGGQPHTETVIGGADVLSIEEADAFEGLTTLVILVSPDEAEQLGYARSFADLSVTVASAEELS